MATEAANQADGSAVARPVEPHLHGIAAGSSHTLAILKDAESTTRVLSWGRAEDGQLGHGDANEQHRPRVVETLKGADASLVACGAEHSVVVCKESKEVYSWGWGDFGRLGHGDPNDVFIPRSISALSGKPVRAVSCGDTHSLAVLEDGTLLSFGRNQNGQLGLGTRDDMLTPQHVTRLSHLKVAGAACGAEHSICVTEDGEVYAFGWGRFGNLGNGNYCDESVPVKMKGLDGVVAKHVRCGWRHSMIIDDKHRLFTCGWGKYGQLGHSDFMNRNVPMVVEHFANDQVTKVEGGWRHTLACTRTQLYAWGWSKFGQLGLGKTADIPTPTAVPHVTPEGVSIDLIACGWKHSIVVNSKGTCYAWGRGTNGQLGMPRETDTFEPTELTALSKGHIDVEALEQGLTGNERMFVPAAERYAVVPNNDDTLVSEATVPEAQLKRARLC